MKKCWFLMCLALLLTGCNSTAETVETLTDEYIQPVMATMQQAVMVLPEDASLTVMESDSGDIVYLCDGYTITLHTCQAGDLDKTLREATGFSKDALKLIQTESAGVERTQCVWTAAGESEEQVGRLTVLDDGNYHYVLTCMAGASQTQRLQPVWQELFDSFRLVGADVDLSIGS